MMTIGGKERAKPWGSAPRQRVIPRIGRGLFLGAAIAMGGCGGDARLPAAHSTASGDMSTIVIRTAAEEPAGPVTHTKGAGGASGRDDRGRSPTEAGRDDTPGPLR